MATGWPAGGGTSSRSGASGIAGRQQRAQDKFKIKATKNNAATELLSLSELPVPIMLGGKKPRIKRQVLVLTSLAHLTPRPTWPLKSPTTTKALNRVRWPARVCFCTGMIFITCRRGGWKGETCVGVRVGRKKDVCPCGGGGHPSTEQPALAAASSELPPAQPALAVTSLLRLFRQAGRRKTPSAIHASPSPSQPRQLCCHLPFAPSQSPSFSNGGTHPQLLMPRRNFPHPHLAPTSSLRADPAHRQQHPPRP